MQLCKLVVAGGGFLQIQIFFNQFIKEYALLVNIILCTSLNCLFQCASCHLDLPFQEFSNPASFTPLFFNLPTSIHIKETTTKSAATAIETG